MLPEYPDWKPLWRPARHRRRVWRWKRDSQPGQWRRGSEREGFAPKVHEEKLTTNKPERRGEGTWIPVMTLSETSHALLKTTSSRLGFVAGQTALAATAKQAVKRLYAAANFGVNRVLVWCSSGCRVLVGLSVKHGRWNGPGTPHGPRRHGLARICGSRLIRRSKLRPEK